MAATRECQPWPVIACDRVKEKKRGAAGTRHVHRGYARLLAMAGRYLRRRDKSRRLVEQATCQRKVMLRRGRLRGYRLSAT
jgi:primosomal protein N''